MQNIELKVKVRDLRTVQAACRHLVGAARDTLRQTDVYFKVPTGRLKLREINHAHYELISYTRPDRTGSRTSTYQRAHLTSDTANILKTQLTEALGVLVSVGKHRELFIYRNTRIHLDDVWGLGTFVELETAVDGRSQEEAQQEHDDVISFLGLDTSKSLAGSYSDLLLRLGL